MKVSFSVVIPCLNEEKYVGLLLADLQRQSLQPDEVVVVDSRSTDRTLAVVAGFEKVFNLKIAHSDIQTPGAARNRGAEVATGEYLVFMDADTRLHSADFMQDLGALTEDGKIDYITPLYTTDSKHPIDLAIIRVINRHFRYDTKIDEYLPGMGCVLCVRRRIHEQMHGFDDHLAKENDMEYLERLKDMHPSYKVGTDLWAETSSRRYRKHGRIVGLLNFTSRNSFVGKRMVYPFLKKIGRDKQYGIF